MEEIDRAINDAHYCGIATYGADIAKQSKIEIAAYDVSIDCKNAERKCAGKVSKPLWTYYYELLSMVDGTVDEILIRGEVNDKADQDETKTS